MAEFERALIQERVKANARAKGTRLGRQRGIDACAGGMTLQRVCAGVADVSLPAVHEPIGESGLLVPFRDQNLGRIAGAIGVFRY
jgi:hypothetical protein